MTKKWYLCFLIFTMTGCLVGQTIAYNTMMQELKVPESNGQLFVTVWDQRPYIVNEDFLPTFVGYLRGGFGNKFHLNTFSGNPLSEDIGVALDRAFRNTDNTYVGILKATHRESLEQIIQHAKETTTSDFKILLLTLKEWKSDTYMNSTFFYDLELSVLDNTGKVILKEVSKGESPVPGSLDMNPAVAKRNVPLEAKNVLQELLTRGTVRRALMK